MAKKPHSLLKASDIDGITEIEFRHPLNPHSEIYLRTLGTNVGFKRLGISLARLPDGGGRFTEVILKPEIIITAESNLETAKQLHDQAHELCFIANSVNFPIFCQPSYQL